MKDKIKETFNSLAGAYEHSVDTENLYNNEYERPAMLAQLPKDLSEKRMLDAGCAAGWYTEKLVDRGAQVTAVDMSPEMAAATKRRVGDRADVRCLDLASALPFEDGTFDYIVSSLTLHYIEDWDLTFKEFQRILKPGGTLLFSVHHPFTDIKLSREMNYFSTELIVDKWKKEGKVYNVPFFRRPLGDILAKTLQYFSMEDVIEPKPTERFKELDTERYERLMKAPNFLIVKSKKQ
ncbi:class I SAM-dependent methyltransferase [Planococcus maritimus]|nr:class I SAM-dependent methyltransferase [Planococcus sp. SK3692]MDE4085288.1 class I SAM-dependent methyltransferase [Planococcus maritimus]